MVTRNQLPAIQTMRILGKLVAVQRRYIDDLLEFSAERTATLPLSFSAASKSLGPKEATLFVALQKQEP